MIAIRTVIDRSQPPNAAGTLSCSIFCIALTSTSWHSSCASAVVAEPAQRDGVDHRLEPRGQFAERVPVAGLRGLDQVLEGGGFVVFDFAEQCGHGSLDFRKRSPSVLGAIGGMLADSTRPVGRMRAKHATHRDQGARSVGGEVIF